MKGKGKPGRNSTKKASGDSDDKKGADKDGDKTKSPDPCKFSPEHISRVCHSPSDSESCRGCGTKFDNTVSNIPCPDD